MFSEYFGGYILPSTIPTLPYTPIVIQFEPFALQDNDEPIENRQLDGNRSQYHLIITPPRSNRRGDEQYIADSIIISVPADGLLKFKLKPSDRYLPLGRYKVQYYRKGRTTPIDEQEWIVPSLPLYRTYNYIVDNDTHVLPLYIWRVESVSAGDQWSNDFNRLILYGESRVPDGTQVNVKYEPAATLDMLLEYKQYNQSGIERERG